MEFLNRVELRGIVGSVNVTEVGGETAVRFSVATDHSYKGRNGELIIETTWHNCTAWSSTAPECTKLKKMDTIHLKGRIRATNYSSADYGVRAVTDIFVNSLEILSL